MQLSHALDGISFMKKTAFVHDRIVHLGGAENVLQELITHYGTHEQQLFVLFSPYQKLTTAQGWIPVVTALPRRCNHLMHYFTQHKRPFLSWLLDYRNLMPLYPLLIRLLRKKINRYAPDRVVISSFAAVKNIVPPSSSHTQLNTNCILYLHSPMQYIRENYDEYLKKLRQPKKAIFQSVSGYLRQWDRQERTYQTVYTNSTYTAHCARLRYGITDAEVRYPTLPEIYLTTPAKLLPDDYYLYIGRLVRFIRETDLIIELANRLKLPLVVMGGGPDEHYLKSIAGSTVIFVGNVTAIDQKVAITQKAKGLINLAKESCGIATMEALTLGVPVFGYSQGGTVELVQKEMGLLMERKELNHLISEFQKFASTEFDRPSIQNRFRDYYLHQRKTITHASEQSC